jgi:death-on-curing protein
MTATFKIGQPRFLSKEEILTLHRASLDAYGGADGFVNEGALDSAIAQPQQGFAGEFVHEFPFGMAAAYGFHIAMNHAFRDGNKRTAFAAMVAFLRMNGWNFIQPDDAQGKLLLDMIEQRHDKAWLADQLQLLSRARPALELRDFFRHFDYETARTHIISTHQGGNQAEVDATVLEATSSLPIVRDLHALLVRHQEQGKEIEAQRVLTALVLFIAMFRVAEDMGYEW